MNKYGSLHKYGEECLVQLSDVSLQDLIETYEKTSITLDNDINNIKDRICARMKNAYDIEYQTNRANLKACEIQREIDMEFDCVCGSDCGNGGAKCCGADNCKMKERKLQQEGYFDYCHYSPQYLIDLRDNYEFYKQNNENLLIDSQFQNMNQYQYFKYLEKKNQKSFALPEKNNTKIRYFHFSFKYFNVITFFIFYYY